MRGTELIPHNPGYCFLTEGTRAISNQKSITFHQPTHRKCVLCIDDDVRELQLRKAVLEIGGYDVMVAESGQAGLAILEHARPDVVVLDYAMPEMDGPTVATQIRKLCCSVPIIILSGHDSSEFRTVSRVDRWIRIQRIATRNTFFPAGASHATQCPSGITIRETRLGRSVMPFMAN